MEHLMNIDCDTESIDLYSKKICGTLDFKRFNKLKKLECRNNHITSIINLPSTLEFLDISYNNITSLNNLPSSLIHLVCSYNNIKSFDNLPISLKKLNSTGNNSNFNYDNLTLYQRLCREDEDNLIKLTNLPISLNSIVIRYKSKHTVLADVLEYNNYSIMIHFGKSRKIRKVLEENRMRLYL